MSDRYNDVEPADVLLVEPTAETARSMRDGLSNHRSAVAVHAVSDGEEALDFLHQHGEYADAPRPSIVFLRFDLPESGPSSSAVLEAMWERPELERIPVIVTVGSASEEAVRDAYRLGANAVVPMPTDADAIAESMELVATFWLGSARLPNRDDRR